MLAFAITIIAIEKIFISKTGTRTVKVESIIKTNQINGTNNIYDLYKDNIFVCNENDTRLINLTGEKTIWSEKINSINKIYQREDDYILLGTKSGYKMVLFNEKGKVIEYNTQYAITNVSLNKNGYTGVIQESEDRNLVTVYNNKGKKIIERVTYSEKAGRPMSCDISDDNRYLAITYLRIEGMIIKSDIVFIDMKSEELSDNIYATKIYENQIIHRVEYLKTGNLVAISDAGIMNIDMNRSVNLESKFEGEVDLLFFDKERSKVAVLLNERKKMKIYNAQSLETKSTEMPANTQLFKLQNGLIVVGTKSYLYSYTLSSARGWNIKMPQVFNDILVLDNSRIMTIGGNQNTIYNIN